MGDKASAQDKAEIDKAIQDFSAERLTEEEEVAMVNALHAQIVNNISLPEALKIIAAVSMEELKKQVETMSDEEKVQTYKDLNLK